MLLKQQFSKISKTASLLILFSFMLTNTFVAQSYSNVKDNSTRTFSAGFPVLTRYSTDLTMLARSGKLSVNLNFEREVNLLIKSLSNGNSRQAVILDEAGDNQELVVKTLASRITAGDVPANLKGKRVLKLELDTLFADVKDNDEAANRIEAIVSELGQSKGDVILFVNELTNFVGNSQISSKLTESLLQGKVQIIGGSSKAAYSEKIESNAEVAAIFEPIVIGSVNLNDSEEAVNGNVENNDGFRGDNVASDLREMLSNDTTNGAKRLDVILQTKDADNQVLRRILAENKVRLQDRIGTSNTMVVNLPLKAVEALAASGLINYMSPDRQVNFTGHLENTTGTATIRTQQTAGTRAAYTLDGTGVGIAVLDSGMQVDHKDFKNASNASRIVFSKSFVTTTTTTDDDYGHGTHVAGIAAGNTNNNSGAYRGVAPNANLINLKVLDGQGRGQSSWLLSALDWIKLNYTTYNIKVVNLSLGGLAIDSYTNDPVCRKVQELNALGILVVAAAGNEGKTLTGQKIYGQIHSPGNDPSVLTVGAVNTKDTDSRSDDIMATFSSNGPTRSFYTNSAGTRIYDNTIKPDLVAPGNKIISARAKATSYLILTYPSLGTGLTNLLDANDNMLTMSGTSMATPVVAGAAALLYQVNPNLTPQMVKMILEYTAQPLSGYNMLEQGAGQLNLEGAVRLAKAYRTDVNFNSTAATSGMSLLAAGTTFPTATTTLNGAAFSWSQGILTSHTYLKGQNVADMFHNVYKNGSWFEKGIAHNTARSYVLNTDFNTTTNISVTPRVVVSNGLTLGDGTFFRGFGVLVSNGVLVTDAVLVSDGVLVGDGVLAGDSVLVSDGVLSSDSTRANSVINGDSN